MPALRGSLTYTRFFVEGEAPRDAFNGSFLKAIRAKAMRPLEPDEEELERSGWSKVGEPFVTDLSSEDVFWNEYVNLGFRTDRWAISPSLLRRHLQEAETAYLTKKGRERLSRREKAEMKLMVTKKLRRSVEPVTRSVDLSWAINEGVVRFFSHAPKPGGLMTELFKKTFGLTLVPESPYTLAERIGLDKAQKAAWNALEPVDVAAPDAKAAAE